MFDKAILDKYNTKESYILIKLFPKIDADGTIKPYTIEGLKVKRHGFWGTGGPKDDTSNTNGEEVENSVSNSLIDSDNDYLFTSANKETAIRFGTGWWTQYISKKPGGFNGLTSYVGELRKQSEGITHGDPLKFINLSDLKAQIDTINPEYYKKYGQSIINKLVENDIKPNQEKYLEKRYKFGKEKYNVSISLNTSELPALYGMGFSSWDNKFKASNFRIIGEFYTEEMEICGSDEYSSFPKIEYNDEKKEIIKERKLIASELIASQNENEDKKYKCLVGTTTR